MQFSNFWAKPVLVIFWKETSFASKKRILRSSRNKKMMQKKVPSLLRPRTPVLLLVLPLLLLLLISRSSEAKIFFEETFDGESSFKAPRFLSANSKWIQFRFVSNRKLIRWRSSCRLLFLYHRFALLRLIRIDDALISFSLSLSQKQNRRRSGFEMAKVVF